MNCGSCNVALPADARFCAACGQPIPGAPGPAAGAPPSSKWVVILVIAAGLLVFLFVGGIVAAIAIPNLLNAVDRAKQKRTMADMRSIGVALEGYREENSDYPAGDDLESFRSKLEPGYIHNLPTKDGWGHPFVVSSNGSTYQLISGGKDGARDGCDGGATTRFADDICLSDGEFTQWPEGIRK